MSPESLLLNALKCHLVFAGSLQRTEGWGGGGMWWEAGGGRGIQMENVGGYVLERGTCL